MNLHLFDILLDFKKRKRPLFFMVNLQFSYVYFPIPFAFIWDLLLGLWLGFGMLSPMKMLSPQLTGQLSEAIAPTLASLGPPRRTSSVAR
jgi:hypothetical protein